MKRSTHANAPYHEHAEEDDRHDRGLAFDLKTLLERRHALKLLGGAAALALVGCGSESVRTATSTAANPTAGGAATGSGAAAASTAVVSAIPAEATTPASACVAEVPEETGGPFPGDGTNGPNALSQSGIVRSDIRSSFGTSTTTAPGVPLTVKLTILDTKNSCKPLAGAAVYIWHCDAAGRYSMYSSGVTNENYLRGVQAADANGVVTFKSIFPACYSGRWPHIHFEVYPTLAKANASASRLVTSQLALPEDVSRLVFATKDYPQSVQNLSQVSLKTDMVFSDGWDLQTPTMAGSVSAGYTASLMVGV